MQSFSVIDLYGIVYEVCMNFKQSRHAFLQKMENASSGKIVWLKENWSWIKSRVPWCPNLGKTLGNILSLQICWFLIHMQSFFNLNCNQKFLCNRLRWSPLFSDYLGVYDFFSLSRKKLIHYIVKRVKRVSKRNVFAFKMIAHHYLYKQDRLGLNHLKFLAFSTYHKEWNILKYLNVGWISLFFLEFFGAQNSVCDKTIM